MGRQGAHSAALLLQTLVQLESKHHVGEFALAIGLPTVVALFSVEVIPGNAAEVLGSGCHRHHSGVCLAFHERQQPQGEGHVPEVIGGPLQLKTLPAYQPRWCHHAGVVDQEIKAPVAALDGGNAIAHAGEIGQVQIHTIKGSSSLFPQ